MNNKYSKAEKSLLTSLGIQIRERRIFSGLSQEDLAFESNLDRTYVGSVERGERNISIINLNKLCLALKIELHQLLILVK